MGSHRGRVHERKRVPPSRSFPAACLQSFTQCCVCMSYVWHVLACAACVPAGRNAAPIKPTNQPTNHHGPCRHCICWEAPRRERLDCAWHLHATALGTELLKSSLLPSPSYPCCFTVVCLLPHSRLLPGHAAQGRHRRYCGHHQVCEWSSTRPDPPPSALASVLFPPSPSCPLPAAQRTQRWATAWGPDAFLLHERNTHVRR